MERKRYETRYRTTPSRVLGRSRAGSRQPHRAARGRQHGVSWRTQDGPHVVTVFLILVIVAMVLGLIGAAAGGVLYLLVIGILVFVVALVFLGMHGRRSGRRHLR